MNSMKRYFSYDPEDCSFEIHDTAENARKRAEDVLESYRDSSCDEGWDEDEVEDYWPEICDFGLCPVTTTKVKPKGLKPA